MNHHLIHGPAGGAKQRKPKHTNGANRTLFAMCAKHNFEELFAACVQPV